MKSDTAVFHGARKLQTYVFVCVCFTSTYLSLNKKISWHLFKKIFFAENVQLNSTDNILNNLWGGGVGGGAVVSLSFALVVGVMFQCQLIVKAECMLESSVPYAATSDRNSVQN